MLLLVDFKKALFTSCSLSSLFSIELWWSSHFQKDKNILSIQELSDYYRNFLFRPKTEHPRFQEIETIVSELPCLLDRSIRYRFELAYIVECFVS